MAGDTQRGAGRRATTAAWFALTAPGALITCVVLSTALLVGPYMAPWVLVPRGVRLAAVALVALHAGLTLLLRLRPASWPLAVLFQALLAGDALLCGVLLAAQHHGPALLLAGAAVIMSLEVAGWFGALVAITACAAGAGGAAWIGLGTVLFLVPAPTFPTTLAVETAFGGSVVLAPAVPTFATALSVETAGAVSRVAVTFPAVLSVETSLGEVPAFASAEELFVPSLAVVLVALCLGLAVSLWHVRRARTAVASSIVAAARATP